MIDHISLGYSDNTNPKAQTTTKEQYLIRPLTMMLGGLTFAIALSVAHIGYAQSAPYGFAELVEDVDDAVVNISTKGTVEVNVGGLELPFDIPKGTPFEDFFREYLQPEQRDRQIQERPTRALGSGFVISDDGYIVTNNHVIENADEISIEFISGETLEATLVGADPKTDIALLKVESPKKLAHVTFGDSNEMRVGDWVVAIGNPLGQGFSVSAGIVSARNRELAGTYDDFIQTDAAINRGNSGGPLFNTEGDVIGVNTAIISPSGGSIGIGFSMASNLVTKVVDQLKEFGETRRGWLGVRIQDVTADIAEALGLSDTTGALVVDAPDGPAKDAGIQSGDIIVKFDGKNIKDAGDLTGIVADSPIGEEVQVELIRKGEPVNIDVLLGRREEAEATPQAQAKPAVKESVILGMTLAPISSKLIDQYQLPPNSEGVLVTDVDVNSQAAEVGISAGNLIVSAGQEPISTPDQLEAEIEKSKENGRKSILLFIKNSIATGFVALSIE